MKIVITATILVLSEIIVHIQGITVGPVRDSYHGYYAPRAPAYDEPLFTPIKKSNPASGARVSISKIKPVVFQSNAFRRTRGGRKFGQPFQLDLKQRNYQEQQDFLRRKQPYHYYSGTFPLKTTPFPSNSQVYKFPEMKKNHQVLREQVDVLKQKQKVLFTDEDDERPATRTKAAEFIPDKSYASLEDITASNEKTFFDEQKHEFDAIRQKFTEPIKSSSSQILTDDEDGKYRPELYETDSDFNAGFSYRKMPNVLHKIQYDGEKFGFLNNANGIQKSPYKYENYDELDDDGQEIEDSEGDHSFIPVQRYAQVRKSETLAVQPKIPSAADLEKRPKSRLKTEKSHTLYTEQGYEDSEYDHGGEDKFGKIEINKKLKRLRRSAEFVDDSTEIEAIEELPISLPLTKVRNLKGDELIDYITELLKNSTVYAPDEDFHRHHDADHEAILKEQAIIRKNLKDKDHDSAESGSSNTESYAVPDKFPYYNLPTDVLNEMSALRYAQNIPKFSSYYDTKSKLDCDRFDPQIDNMPKPIPKGDYNENHAKNQRLGQLGERINCLKAKYFGQHPLDNPIFKERFIQSNLNPYFLDSSYQATSARPVSSKNLIKNPSINVYDDVVSNIRMAIKRSNHKKAVAPGQKDDVIYWKYVPPAELAKAKNQQPIKKATIDFNTDDTFIAIFKKKNQKKNKKTKPTDLVKLDNSASELDYQYSANSDEQAPNSNLFDITQYLPKVFMIKSDGKIYAVKYKKKIQKDPDYTVFPMEAAAATAYLGESDEFDHNDGQDTNEKLSYEQPPPLPANRPSLPPSPSPTKHHQRFAYPLRRPYIIAAPSYTYPKRVKVYERVILV